MDLRAGGSALLSSLVTELAWLALFFPLPLMMGASAAIPRDWSVLQVYIAIAILVGVSAAIPVLALVYQTVRRELMALAREPDQAVRTYRALPTIPGPGPTPMRLAIRRGFLLAPVSFILALVAGLLPETSLSFLGLGLRPPAVSLGTMLIQAQNPSVVAMHLWLVAPGVVLVIAMAAFWAIARPFARMQRATVEAEQAAAAVQGQTEAVPAYAGLKERWGALTIDGTIILAISLAVAAFEFSLISAVLTLGGLVYVFVMLSGFGRSLGGRAAGIKVVRSDGQPVGLRRGLLRAVVGAVSIFVTLGLGFYLIAFDGRKRALSDVLAGTVVIRTASAAQGQPETAPAYAGFGQRWWALTIDGTIILSLTLAVAAFESPLIAAVLTLGGLRIHFRRTERIETHIGG